MVTLTIDTYTKQYRVKLLFLSFLILAEVTNKGLIQHSATIDVISFVNIAYGPVVS